MGKLGHLARIHWNIEQTFHPHVSEQSFHID